MNKPKRRMLMMANKRLLASITLSLITGLFILMTAQAQEGRSSKRAIEGSWKARVTVAPGPGAGPPFDALVTYSAGGGLVESDSLFPPSIVSAGHGSWEFAGRTFNNTFIKLMFNPQGQFTGTIKVREKITLSFTKNEYTGAGKADFLDPAGNLLVSVDFTTQATRIRVEPLD
jgi:hypothetical protein